MKKYRPLIAFVGNVSLISLFLCALLLAREHHPLRAIVLLSVVGVAFAAAVTNRS